MLNYLGTKIEIHPNQYLNKITFLKKLKYFNLNKIWCELSEHRLTQLHLIIQNLQMPYTF